MFFLYLLILLEKILKIKGKSLFYLRIADILYDTDELRRKREDFQKQRISYLDGKGNFPQLYLTKFNIILDEDAKKKGIEEN